MKMAALTAVLAALLGIGAGLGGYTFLYAHGASYMTNDPAACANCHVMEKQYSAWMKSSHRAVAVCNDCHTPPGLVPKYVTKASNGFWHSFYFTTGGYPENILIRPRNVKVAEKACRKCHQAIVDAIESHGDQGDTNCLRCHADVGHRTGK
jgi:cytochrome c nitrite reductase small subunit